MKELKGFYTHATAYVLVNIGLFVINLLTGGGWWFYWPLLGWGIGLGVHALSVFGFSGSGPWGQDWEERKTREIMDRDRRRFDSSKTTELRFSALLIEDDSRVTFYREGFGRPKEDLA